MKLSTPKFALPLLVLPGLTMAQQSAAPAEGGGTPIETLIEQVAEDLGREFVIDPRVMGLMSFTTSEEIDYESLLGILRINNLVALEAGDQIHVTSEQNMRVAATRILQEDDPSVSDHEVVTRIIEVPQLPEVFPRAQVTVEGGPLNPFQAVPSTTAAQLVPVLRPMMGQSAMLGAVPNTNTLILVDRYDNVRRITAMIEEIAEGLED
jgi:general secretion pathway protein D